MTKSGEQFCETDFLQICRERQIAATHQRLVLYRTLMQMADHPTPEQVYERVRKELPSISLATVYKTLHLFVEAGIMREVSPHHGSLRIEPNTKRHHHFFCIRCHSLTDLHDCTVDEGALKASVPRGYRIEQLSMELRGICGRCATGESVAQA